MSDNYGWCNICRGPLKVPYYVDKITDPDDDLYYCWWCYRLGCKEW